jgi:hypothetical protein
MTPTYHLRGTPWPLSVSGPKHSVVFVPNGSSEGFDVAWFFREDDAKEYIKLMEDQEKRRKE